MNRVSLWVRIALVLTFPSLAGCGTFEEMARLAGGSEPGEIGDRWRTGDRLYGTVSATMNVGTIDLGEYSIKAQSYFELRYSRSLRAWEGRSDAVNVSLEGRHRVRSGTGEIVNFTMSGSGTTDGVFEILVEDDETYTVRFYSGEIEYTERSDSGHSTRRTGGRIGSDWGLPGNPIPSDRVNFSGSGLMLSPDEEGLAGRSRTELSWSFSTTPRAR